MSVRNATYRGFGFSVRIPERLPEKLRAAARGKTTDPVSGVELRTPPPLFAQRRDPTTSAASVIDFYSGGRDHPLDPDSLAALPLADQVDTTRWYHTIELPGGVITPGALDHRPLVPHYGIPDSLAGKRCLDAACSNGFWAFEFERRGGTVVALDIPSIANWDFPAGTPPLATKRPDTLAAAAFDIARRALGSKVDLVRHNLYTMGPDDLGTFDFVHMSDVLLHLRNPLDALQRLCSLTAPDGNALIADVFDPELTGMTSRYLGGFHDVTWSIPSLECLTQLVYDAGFAKVEVATTYTIPGRAGWRAVLRASP